jgi:Kef-type K+ transport system membrane component KefB
MSRLAKRLGLPAVTAYLVAGILLGPYCLGRLGLTGLGFHSDSYVTSFNIISQAALGFIAFTIGDEFRLPQIKKMGGKVIIIGILQAVITTILVDLVLLGVHFLAPDRMSLSSAITLGAIAAATAPAATLMVVQQYNADGPLTHLLLMVVALDDAVGLILFAASFGVASALESGLLSVSAIVLEPLLEIILSLALGACSGFLLYRLEPLFHSKSKKRSLTIAIALLLTGVSCLEFDLGAVHVSFSLLLVCMMAGATFCNLSPNSKEVMDRIDHWAAPLNILFFVLSGAALDLKVLSQPWVLLMGLIYIAARSLGKYSGAYLSCKLTRCDADTTRHLGITLLPQAGVALGMVLTAQSLAQGQMIRNVILFAVLVYELVGPSLTKRSLMAVGEIKPEKEPSPAPQQAVVLPCEEAK